MRTRIGRLRSWDRLLMAMGVVAIVAAGARAETWVAPTVHGEVSVERDATPRAPRVIVEQPKPDALRVRVSVPGFELSQHDTDNGAFVMVGCPDTALDGLLGAPALPVIRRILTVPQGAEVTVDSRVIRSAAVTLAELGYALPIVPRQAAVSMEPESLAAARFHYDRSF